MRIRSHLFAGLLPLAAAAASAYQPHVDRAALEQDERWLAADERDGRSAGTPGGIAAREYLIDQLVQLGPGLVETATGRDAYRQPFDVDRANLLAVIPGAGHADEFVMVGAHYDHFSSENCPRTFGSDEICNGATDDAAGVSAVLAIGRALLALPTPPSRSVVIALWDGEEYGLLGSKYFANHPIVPLADVAAYVNFDIQGANIAPSVRDISFAIGAESGGELLTSLVADAIAAVGLGTRQLSITFGQARSDYHPIWAKKVPIVFFSDATNACYHTAGDEIGIVDFGKLARQAEIGFRVVQALAESSERPTYTPVVALDTYDDLLALSEFLTRTLADLPHVEPNYQDALLYYEELARMRVDAGPDAFQATDALTIALGAIDIASEGFPCDPLLLPEPDAAVCGAGALLAIATSRARTRRRGDRSR